MDITFHECKTLEDLILLARELGLWLYAAEFNVVYTPGELEKELARPDGCTGIKPAELYAVTPASMLAKLHDDVTSIEGMLARAKETAARYKRIFIEPQLPISTPPDPWP